MSRLVKIILTLLCIGIIIGYMVFSTIESEREFNKIDLDKYKSKNVVVNLTNKAYLDTVAYMSLNSLGIRNKYITITNITPSIEKKLERNIKFNAFTVRNDSTYYTIYIDSNKPKTSNIETISHESIHIKQYDSGRLKKLNGNVYVFDGDTIDAFKVSYLSRPWEREAFRNQYKIEDSIESILW